MSGPTSYGLNLRKERGLSAPKKLGAQEQRSVSRLFTCVWINVMKASFKWYCEIDKLFNVSV